MPKKGRTKRGKSVSKGRLNAARRRRYRARREFQMNPNQATYEKQKSAQRALYRAKRAAAGRKGKRTYKSRRKRGRTYY